MEFTGAEILGWYFIGWFIAWISTCIWETLVNERLSIKDIVQNFFWGGLSWVVVFLVIVDVIAYAYRKLPDTLIYEKKK
tara:strand:- start:432 stop:668 length:237 start_codon:yes stop_codon:yes gene_type:complete